MPKLLSVCIPTYNRCEKLVSRVKILTEIISKNHIDSIEIIVSDNNSEDNTSSAIEEFLPTISFYRQSINLGYDGNVKFLYNVSCSKFVFFLSDDDEIFEEAFVKLYWTILENQNTDCFILNYQHGHIIDNLSYIDTTKLYINLRDLDGNFYKPFVFLSGFVLRKKSVNSSDLIEGSFFMQIDIALSVLSQESVLYIFGTNVINRIIPQDEDETGCNIADERWKVWLGLPKVCRKYEEKLNLKLPFYFEIDRLISFIRIYAKHPSKNMKQTILITLKAISALKWRYRLRLIGIPIIFFAKVIRKYL